MASDRPTTGAIYNQPSKDTSASFKTTRPTDATKEKLRMPACHYMPSCAPNESPTKTTRSHRCSQPGVCDEKPAGVLRANALERLFCSVFVADVRRNTSSRSMDLKDACIPSKSSARHSRQAPQADDLSLASLLDAAAAAHDGAVAARIPALALRVACAAVLPSASAAVAG